MKVNTIKVNTKKGLFTCYYPKYYAEWIVKFRTVFGYRREKILTLGDGVANQLGIIESLPDCEIKEVNNENLIAYQIHSEEFQTNCYDKLRKYFIYKRRSWQVPEIELLSEFMVYVPYQIESKKKLLGDKTETLLYEPISKHYDKLKNYKVIQNFYMERRDIS
ncbi:hypothetical protein [Oceanobacillus salinisoli]|uniref:hypothetical protein n=1 Tax=Oceanobacillus salinisoli TaxID=2678611 RepID=UPI0012E29326|nr:hypothetical protein [Oceanobacillus salinisoli]